MNVGKFTLGFITVFAITFVVAATVSFLYSLIVHGTGVVDWEQAFRLGVIFGFVLPIVQRFKKREKAE